MGSSYLSPPQAGGRGHRLHRWARRVLCTLDHRVRVRVRVRVRNRVRAGVRVGVRVRVTYTGGHAGYCVREKP